jgi:hypothetical protein
VSDVDLPVRRALDALAPEPRREPDWQDVLRRAQPRLLQRPVVLALAATLLLLGTAAGVTAALGGFDAWLSGKPGKTAPAAEQQRFEAANGRTWAAFPKGTELRELIRTTAGGKTYVLFGFRSGHTLCLKLRAVTLGHSTEPACTPESTLAHSTSPIVVVNSDFGFADRHAHESAEFSFGIAADGVSRVDVLAVDGRHQASVGGNAYLFVENEPNTGNRVLSISAVGPNAKKTAVSLGTTYGDFGVLSRSTRQPPGPAHVETRIAHPAIGWLLRGEKRGFSSDRLDVSAFTRSNIIVSDARFVKPDPLSDIVVGLQGAYCLLVVQGPSIGQSCSDREDFLSRGAVNVIMSGGGGVQASTLVGAAADGVARLTLFDANGLRIRVPLKDNLFGLRVASSQFSVRLVAYDTRGRVVGTQVFRNELGGPTLAPSAFRRLRAVERVGGPNGASGVLRLGGTHRGYRCWRVDFSTGQSPHGCIEIFPTGPWTSVDLVQPAGRDLFVIGHTRPPVTTVELHFQDGRVVQLTPTSRLFVAAIPRAYLKTRRQLAFAVGYDAAHRVVQRQGFVFRVRP